MIRTRWHTALFCLAALGLLGPAEAQVQNWPTQAHQVRRALRPGGGNDIIARVIGEKLNQSLGQPIIIDNRSGAGGNIGAEFVAKSAADGYTFLVTPNAILTVNPHLYAKIGYDPLKDFTPVGQLGVLPVVLVVNASVRAKSVAELIDHAKANPDALSYASGDRHTAPSRRGAVQVHDRHQDGAYPLQGRCAGGNRLHRRPSASHVRSDQQHHAVSRHWSLTRARSWRRQAPSSLPGVPTIAEAGVPGFNVDNWVALVAPAGTPNDIVAKLSDAIGKILAQPEVREKIEATGIEPAFSPPEQLAEMIRAGYVHWGTIIRNAGIKAD